MSSAGHGRAPKLVIRPILAALVEFVMAILSRLLLASSLGIACASGAVAQQMQAASAPMGGASMPHDCKAMHGSGSGKPMSMMKSMNCPMDAAGAASAPAKKQPAKPDHDHSKLDKNQG